METHAHNERQLWYIRRDGQIDGPFPMKQISQYILLGRLGEGDEVSCDLVTWHPPAAFPGLVPDIMGADPGDPLARQRLLAARRWADERAVPDRRQAGQQVDEERRSREDRRRPAPDTVPRRLKEAGRGKEEAAGRAALRRPVTMLLLGLVAVVGVMMILGPGNDDKGTAIDCDHPPAPGVNWSNCFKEGVDLHGADLRGAHLKNMRLTGARLNEARLHGADLSYSELAVASLGGADLGDSVLIGAGLRGADLRGADLRGANLAYADLRGARLQDAVLEGAVLGSAIWTDGRYCAPQSVGSCLFSEPPPRDRL